MNQPTAVRPIPTTPVDLILVGTSESVTGQERLLAGIREGAQLSLLIEAHRPSNAPLLDACGVYLHSDAGTDYRPVIERRALQPAERRHFEAATPAPLGANLEIMQLGPPTRPSDQPHAGAP